MPEESAPEHSGPKHPGPEPSAPVSANADPSVHGKAPLSVGGWIVIVSLGGLLGVAIWIAFYGWNLTDAALSTPGIISLILGVVLSIALGGGLMGLVFYSNRKGYDR